MSPILEPALGEWMVKSSEAEAQDQQGPSLNYLQDTLTQSLLTPYLIP